MNITIAPLNFSSSADFPATRFALLINSYIFWERPSPESFSLSRFSFAVQLWPIIYWNFLIQILRELYTPYGAGDCHFWGVLCAKIDFHFASECFWGLFFLFFFFLIFFFLFSFSRLCYALWHSILLGVAVWRSARLPESEPNRQQQQQQEQEEQEQ